MRRYDIDSLRVILFILLILYHVGMVFVPWDFHIKNSVIYEETVLPMLFLNQWRLPLLFVISGMGTYYALMKRSGPQFATERLKRLFIPLVIGIIFLVPPQVYLERLDQGQFSGSYLDFWTGEAFVGSYPNGNWSWHHLWFILYLLIFSLILIPIFLYLRKHPETWFIAKLKVIITKRFGLYIFVIPLFLWYILLSSHFPRTLGLVNDWYTLVDYCSFFFFGYLLISLKDSFWDAITKNKHIFLITGIICFPIFAHMHVIDYFPGIWELHALFKIINLWSWTLALIGYAAVYLTKPSKALTYANEAVYPFYILHQTIMIALCYYLKYTDLGFFTKFSIIVIGTFGITWIIYEFGIRRYSIIRPIFGMKSKRINTGTPKG